MAAATSASSSTASCLSRFALPVVLACVLYHGSLNGPFVFDDNSAIKENKDVTSNPSHLIWENNFWGDSMASSMARHFSYRPLTIWTFRLNHNIHGLDPFGYHLVNILCHAAVTALFQYTCEKVFLPKGKDQWLYCMIAGLMFGSTLAPMLGLIDGGADGGNFGVLTCG